MTDAADSESLDVIQSEAKDLDEEKAPEEPAIEATVIATQEDGPSVFDPYTPEELKAADNRSKGFKLPKAPKPPKERKKPKFTWFKHIQNTISKAAGDIFDDMENEEN